MLTFVLVAFLLLFLFGAFVHFEGEHRPEVPLAIVFALVLADVLLYPSQATPRGLFHPGVGSLSFRLPELVIPVALAARAFVRPPRPSVRPVGLLWGAFFLWYAYSFPLGLMQGNPLNLVLFHAKALVYVGGGMLLAAGVPLDRLVNRRTVGMWLRVLGLIALVSIPANLSRTTIPLDIPRLLPGAKLANISPDGGSILLSVGLIGLLVVEARGAARSRVVPVLFAVPLLLCAFAITQRAVIIHLAVSVAVVGVAALGATWRRRMRTTGVEASLLLAAMAVPLLLALIYVSARGPANPSRPVPVVSEVLSDTFSSTRKVQSANSRVSLWRQGADLFTQRPVIAWGLGREYTIYREGIRGFFSGAGFHNIALDLMVRSGIVGVGLFTAALALTFWNAGALWRYARDDRVAALVLGAAAAVAGLLAKGMVESIFEKYRLAALLGLLLGLMVRAPARGGEGEEPSRPALVAVDA